MTNYIMLITYSFDGDYVAVPCQTQGDAIEKLYEYLEAEIEECVKETGVTPKERNYGDLEVHLFYTDDGDEACYRVIEIGHGVNK